MAGLLKREPSPDGRDADNFGHVSSVDEAYKLIAEFETGSTTKFSCFNADKHWYAYIYLWKRYVALACISLVLALLSLSSITI